MECFTTTTVCTQPARRLTDMVWMTGTDLGASSVMQCDHHQTVVRRSLLHSVTVVQLPAVGVRTELVDETTTTDTRHDTAGVVVPVTTTTTTTKVIS